MSFVFRTTAAALAALAVAASPAAARPYYGHGGYYGGYHRYHGGGIGLGGALLGAAIIGGIAVAASNNDRNRDYGYDDGAPPPPAEYGEAAPIVEGESGPVLDCTRAVEDTASQRGGRARVTGIDRVEPIDGGANVLGYVEIDNGGNYAITRTGFSCRAAYGRVTGVRLG